MLASNASNATAITEEANTGYGPWLRGSAIYAVIAIAAVLAAFGWLDPRYFVCVWIGFVILMLLTIAQDAEVAFRRAVFFGLLATSVAFHWVPGVLTETLSLSYANCVLLFLLCMAWDGFQIGLVFYGAARLTASVWARTLALPVLWVALEFLWPRVFPWRLGHSQIEWKEVIQLAELTGVYGVSFLIVWVAAVAAMLVGRWLPGAGPATRSKLELVQAAVCFAALAAAVGFGAWRIGHIESLALRQTPVEVALLQVNVFEEDAHARLIELSREVAPRVDLICWPETSVGVYSLALEDFRDVDKLRAYSRTDDDKVVHPLTDPGCALLCVGKSFSPETPERGPYYVSAFLIDDQEQIIGRYHKRTLLPLGEYVPGDRWLPSLANLALLKHTARAGDSAQVIELPGKVKIGALICYEDMMAANARASAHEGAEVLVSMINGAAFGDSPAMKQHQQLAFFRSIENRRYLLRCSSTGTTSVISPTGKIVGELEPHTTAALTATVYPMDTVTVYTRIGELFSYACLLGAITWGAVRWRTAPP